MCGAAAKTMDDSGAVSFKKPSSRPRGNVRKRERSGDDEEASSAAPDGPRWQTPHKQPPACACTLAGHRACSRRPCVCSISLEMMRELQRQRQRAKGVSLEVKGIGEAVDEALAGAGGVEETDHGLESTFTSQTDSGEVDPNMLKYIEEQMQGGGDGGGDSAALARTSALDAEEAELYTTPAHLIGVMPSNAPQVEEESASRWLAGIMEVPLSTEEKIASIEATERAKREMMSKVASKAVFRQQEEQREHQLSIPTNFNSNFHQHKRESALLRKAAQGAGKGGGPGGAGPRPGGGRDMASDGNAYGRFRAQVREGKR